jgi:hypothetical protein
MQSKMLVFWAHPHPSPQGDKKQTKKLIFQKSIIAGYLQPNGKRDTNTIMMQRNNGLALMDMKKCLVMAGVT